MTTTLALPRRRPRPIRRAWLESAFVVVGLGAAVAARLAATRAGVEPLLVGAVFAAALLGLTGVGGLQIERPNFSLLHGFGGVVVGLALVAVTVVGAGLAGAALIPGLARPAASFAPWAVVTILVAVAEEATLRGVLFDRLQRAGGVLVALIATTILFALMHVPLYGSHVVPLDLAVGLALGGLRIATRGIVAPAMAHAIADLATWWL